MAWEDMKRGSGWARKEMREDQKLVFTIICLGVFHVKLL